MLLILSVFFGYTIKVKIITIIIIINLPVCFGNNASKVVEFCPVHQHPTL